MYVYMHVYRGQNYVQTSHRSFLFGHFPYIIHAPYYDIGKVHAKCFVGVTDHLSRVQGMASDQ